MKFIVNAAVRIGLLSAPLLALATPVAAQEPDFSTFATGPVFTEFGPHAPVEGASAIAADSQFRIAFDLKEQAKAGERNRGFESGARFINMHVASGVPRANIELVMVVHGKAVLDLVTDAALSARDLPANGSAAMVRAMLDAGVRFVVCGQSASVYGVKPDHLIAGVEMNLSAMTAHALLQQRGYTLNPF